MVSKVKFNVAADVTGMEELTRLINRVDTLEKRMASFSRAGGKVQQASDGMRRALDGQSKAARRAQLGAQQFGMQINDLSTSISTGANPMIAFNQQLGQIGYALGQMQGRLQKVGLFLGGVWGAAIGFASMALYNFWQNSKDTEDAVFDLSAAFDANTASSSELKAANEALQESIANTNAELRSSRIATMDDTAAKVANTRAALQQAIANLESAPTFATPEGTEAAAANMNTLSGKVSDLRSRLENLTTSLTQQTGDYEVYISTTSRAAQLQDGLKEGADALNKAYRNGNLSQKELRQGLDDLNKTYLPLIEASKKTEKATRGVGASARKAAKELTELDRAKAALTPKAAALVAAYRAGTMSADEFSNASLALGASLTTAAFRTDDPIKQMEALAKRLERVRKEARAAKERLDEFLAEGSKALELPEISLPDVLKNEEVERWTEGMMALKQASQNVGRAVSDAFSRMLTGAASWKDGMRSIITAVIDQLWQLYVVQQIVGFISKAIGGLGLPSPGASPAPSLGGGFGMREKGGPVQAGKPYIVGEKRPELFIPGTSGTIVPDTKGMGGGGTVINVDARGSSDPEAVRAQVERGILEAAPQIIAASEARTIRSLRRPRLAGGSY